MLHKSTVDESTLELLKQLQQKGYLKGFHLVRGTALALKMGHRKSVDLALFSNFTQVLQLNLFIENLIVNYYQT